MKFRIVLFCALALVIAACGNTTGGAAATVNGEEITVADVEELVTGGSIAEDRLRQELQDLIISDIILSQANEEFGIDPSEDEIEEAYQGLVTQVTANGGGDYDAGLEALGYSDERVRLAAREQLVGQALQEELAGDGGTVDDAAIDEAFAADGGLRFYNACVKHILVETEEDAQTVLDRLASGEDFGELAMEVSTDTGSGAAGGDLGCSTLERYVPEFSQGVLDATVGEPYGPVESEFGQHIILVDSVDDLETARANAVGALAGEADTQALLDWVDEAIAAADVTVDPEYGEWVIDPSPSIIPPGGETTVPSETVPAGTGETTEPPSE